MQEATTRTDVREKLARVERELGAEVLEREEVVRGMVLALIVGPREVSVAEPGPSKSMVSLQTCTVSDYAERLVVQAALVHGPL